MNLETVVTVLSQIKQISERFAKIIGISLLFALCMYAQSSVFIGEGYLFEDIPTVLPVFPDDPPNSLNSVSRDFIRTNLISFSGNSFVFGKGQTVKDAVNSLITNLNCKLDLGKCTEVTNGVSVVLPRRIGFRRLSSEYTINGSWSVGDYLTVFLGLIATDSDSVLLKNENVYIIAPKKEFEKVTPLVISGEIKNAIGDCQMIVKIEGINSSMVNFVVSPSGKYICLLDAFVPQSAVQIGEIIYSYSRPQNKENIVKIEVNGVLIKEFPVNVYTNQSYRVNIDLGEQRGRSSTIYN